MRYAIKQLSELTTADLGAVMMPRAGARIIRRQSKAFTHDNIAKLAKYRQSVGHSRPHLDPLELIATRIETGKLVLIRIPAPLVSSVVSPSGNVNHLLPRALANKVHALAELTLVEDIEHHIRNENSVNQSGGYTSDTAVAAASNSSPAAAASRSMANAATAPVTAPIKESITLNYDYVDGQPIEDIPYIVNHAGDIYEGVLSAGRALISDVDAGSYSVEYKAVDESEIVTLRKELKTNLDGMIAEVKAKAKIQEALIEKESYVMQGLIYSGAFFTGLYESGSSIASGLVEAVESGAEFAFDVGAACWRILKLLGSGDLAGLRREFQEIAKQGGETFDAIKDCFKTLYIIAMDGESRSLLADFPEAYFDAHSSVEKKRLVGKLAFEVIFAIATFGAGAAVSAIAKSKYFVKAGQALQDITKHIKLEKLNHKRDGTTNDDVLDAAERIDDELVLVAPLPYEVKEGVNAFDGSPVIFKRQHKDGEQGESRPDSYTLMPDGKPMGATEGAMPARFEGIKKLPPEVSTKVQEGWPNIIKYKDFANFTDLEAVKLKKGTTIYRIIDEGTSEATKKQSGGYWALELPNSKTEWRKEFAVKDTWNDNGHYIKHKLEENTQVWKGGVAGQAYEEVDGKKFYLQGNNTQIFVKPKLITGDQIKPQLTNWEDAI
ncbi:hypothetical protein [Moritella sp.]|uniref:hypothetical protein n=1 Tax=Moritella sp. TaxID=78556 RepID=UPI001DEC7AC9|nr:hypothetical protein [Moritella sp.]MCJ8351195.1 hypothetical protein [Moritella sp.]NQZ41477.1 hypothetical protein [Moritella sp.]